MEVSLHDDFCSSCGNTLDYGSEEVPNPVENKIEESEAADEVEEIPDEPDTEGVEEISEQSTEDEDEGLIEVNRQESGSLSSFSKVVGVICIPIAAAGFILEILSVLSFATGGYTTGEFVVASIIFGVVAFVPSAYLYYLYKRKNRGEGG
jgi:hypothetical protein